MTSLATYSAKKIRAVQDRILVKGMKFNERISKGGIIIPTDNAKSSGIRPRWAEVCVIGKKQHDVKVGEWVLIEHGRWTRALKMNINGEEIELRLIDNAAIILVSDVPQSDDTWSIAVSAISDVHKIEGSMHNHAGSIFN